jgi:hypothetical protein
MIGLDILTTFIIFLPKTFFESVLLVEPNKIIEGDPVTFGEFLQFVGIWLYILMMAGRL